ncbi:hypothetical protein [Halorientalis salina]|uniref:hypothetical protein n=1 Tax=Halorientalis salina TaxID=2932266 RepID=UPI0010ABB0E8|nr:hypothetical protein [Halorientalis salina]
MCHHLKDEPIDWRMEWGEAEADEEREEAEESADPPEVDLSKPGIGEAEIPEPEIEQPELDD